MDNFLQLSQIFNMTAHLIQMKPFNSQDRFGKRFFFCIFIFNAGNIRIEYTGYKILFFFFLEQINDLSRDDLACGLNRFINGPTH